MAQQQASTSRLGICQTCLSTPARYSCPACQFPSCSLPCSTSHKSVSSCTGIAAPIWSRPLPANEMSWGSLMRDQSYIAGVGRAIEDVGKQLVGEKLIPQGRRLGMDETVRLDERSEKEDKMVREARNQGVELMLLPKGMSKRVKNSTRWDSKKRQLEWMVEVSFHSRPLTDRSAPQQPPTTISTPPIPSNKTLQFALLEACNARERDKKGKGKNVDPEEATWKLTQREWIESFKTTEENVVQETEAGNLEDDVQAEDGDEQAKEDGTQIDEAEPEGEPAHAEPIEPEEGEIDDPVEPEPSTAIETIQDAESKIALSSPPPVRTAPPIDDDSPFILLLSFHSRPVYPDSHSHSHSQPPAPASSSKPPARSVYQLSLSASLTLRQALNGSTILENPCFELWPRETFLRQKLLGKLKVVEQPGELRVRERTGVWERGNNNGRGRGRGGLSERGGFRGRGRGGNRGGSSSFGGEGRSHESAGRSQDSGWGKRGPATEERHGDEKRSRVE
ncbi:zinc finger HIT domain-containing protein [Sporobolomyces salmoneus]|uniref:zinc finger HIT domain-containing protein n=1 Tax=Sporobolomyces salmoneus TaxID=183962 RepID=UPI003172AF10